MAKQRNVQSTFPLLLVAMASCAPANFACHITKSLDLWGAKVADAEVLTQFTGVWNVLELSFVNFLR